MNWMNLCWMLIIKQMYFFLCFPCSPLSLYDGVKLLETLAERIHLSTSSFITHKVKCVCVCVCVFVLIDYWTQGESKRKLDLSAVCLCSVVGSALTFRIRQNALNLSAEDVANKAGEWQAVHFDEMRRHLLINSHIHQHLLSLHCSCWEEFTRGRDRIENHPDRSGRSMPISHFYVLNRKPWNPHVLWSAGL